jgi:hypothetical protein
MITYLTMKGYGSTAKTLHDDLLELQREDVMALVDALTLDESSDIVPENDPVRFMWSGYEYALCIYGMFLCHEWTIRGNRCKIFWELKHALDELGDSYMAPPWSKDLDVIRSHRSNLMRELPKLYSKTFKGTPPNMPYLWPANAWDVKTWEPMGYDLRLSKEDKALLEAGERHLPKRIRERIVNL